MNRNAFTSPSCFSMGGAGHYSYLLMHKLKPAVLNKSRSITTSIVNTSLISSQSLDLNFPLDNFAFSSSLKHISYGVLKVTMKMEKILVLIDQMKLGWMDIYQKK